MTCHPERSEGSAFQPANAKIPRQLSSPARDCSHLQIPVVHRQLHLGRSPYGSSQPRPQTGLGDSCSRLNSRLLADTQLADNFAVAVRVMRLQVIQQAAALADEHQKTTA